MAVQSSDAATLLRKISSFIEDEHLILTIRFLCRKLDIDVHYARELLNKYLESKPAILKDLSVVYLVTAEKPGKSCQETVVAVVLEEDVERWSKGKKNVQKEIYSVQKMKLENSDPIYMMDHPVDIDDVKSLRESSMITCDYVKRRSPEERNVPKSFPEAGLVSVKTVAKIEAEEKKMMGEIGETFHALKVKQEVEQAAPVVEKRKNGKGTTGVAAWVKAGGLDPKKAGHAKDALQAKSNRISPVKTPESDSDDDMFAPKRSKKFAATLMDSDEDEVPAGSPPSDLLEMDSESESPGDSNKTMMMDDEPERSPSPETPRIIRRTGSTRIKPEVTKKNFGKLTSVSDSEEEEVKPPKKKKKVLEEESDEDKPKKSNRKRNKKVVSDDVNSSGDEEGPKRKTAIKKRAKKSTNFYGSDVDEGSAEEPEVEQPEAITKFLTVTPAVSEKRRKQVTKCHEDSEGYMVTEQVWVTDDENGEKEHQPEVKVAEKSSTSGKRPGKVVPKEKKNSDASAGKSKTVQPSITNFFKKRE